MENVWKVGSRWSDKGTPDSSIISIFRRNSIVFVGEDTARERFKNEVKVGDYFAIADGYKVVAVAKAIDEPTLLKNLKVVTVGYESDRFDYENDKDWVVGVRVKIVDLAEKDIICYKKRITFCSANQISEKVKDLYENQYKNFSINSYTCTLFNKIEEKKYNSIFDNHTRYIIPVFQRPYSWGENEIRPFITDLMNNYLGKDRKATNPEPMFIGTMQLSEKKYIDKNEYEQEVIDGQQRITTLAVFLKVLSLKFTTSPELSNLKFDWLETRVNKKQNDYLSEFLSISQVSEQVDENNKYSTNASLLQNIFEEIIDNEPEFNLNLEHLCNYIFTNIYFVVIETYAGLSKTLQIFNAINTTGLDLNGGDLFKIRMYEYLTDKKNEDETAFERISEVYQLIDEKNKEVEKYITSIQEILDIYKDILIAKYDLPDALFQFGWETFYDRLFDTLLGIKTWEHFSKVHEVDTFDIKLDEIKDVIRIRFEWESSTYVSAENMFAFSMIEKSRYSRYWKITYQFLYVYKDDSDRYNKLSTLLTLLNKLFFVYSIIYAKSVYEMHSFMYKILKSVINNSFEEMIAELKTKLSSSDKKWIQNSIGGYITDNAKKKNLICLTSAYLDEIEKSNEIEVIKQLLFETSYDIEHIHANGDITHEIDDDLQNSIGNLVLLESEINRSIKDAPFLKSVIHNKNKKEEFKKSKYQSVQIISEKEKWQEEEIEERRANETNRILEYILTHN